MKIIILSARILAAARIFQAKRDTRTQIIGVHIEKDRISATNGHTLFYMPNVNPDFKQISDSYIDNGHKVLTKYKPFTINVINPIPKSAVHAALIFLDETSGYIEFSGYPLKKYRLGLLPQKAFFNVVNEPYVDIDKVINKFVNKPASEFGINSGYLSYLEKMCTELSGKDHHIVKCFPSSENQAIRYEHPCKKLDAIASVLIMPMRY